MDNDKVLKIINFIKDYDLKEVKIIGFNKNEEVNKNLYDDKEDCELSDKINELLQTIVYDNLEELKLRLPNGEELDLLK